MTDQVAIDKFRFCSVVDWLELEIFTTNLHPAWRVQKASGDKLSFVMGLDCTTGQNIEITGTQGKNTPTTRFALRIQNPERFSSITAALDTIKDRNPLIEVRVRSIEVTFDAYRKSGTTDEELARMTAQMLHEIGRPENANSAPRFYTWRGTAQRRYGKKSLIQGVMQGSTAMYGNADDDFVVRGYLKNYDSVRGDSGKVERITLPNPFEHRARIEVRLQGKACPVQTLDELRAFKFESLARFFKFSQQAENTSVLSALLADRSASLGRVVNAAGQMIEGHARLGRPRKTRPGTRASLLSEIARTKLRELTKFWRQKTGRNRRVAYENPDIKAVTRSPNDRDDFPGAARPNALPNQGKSIADSVDEKSFSDAELPAVLNTSLCERTAHPDREEQTDERHAGLASLLSHSDKPTLDRNDAFAPAMLRMLDEMMIGD